MVKQAKELRKKQTKAEEYFWELVRNRKFLGLKFRRQHQIGPYIADFYCDSKKLIIEIDGKVHNTREQKQKDLKRDKYLTSLGNKVLRFSNADVINNIEYVFDKIKLNLSRPLGEISEEQKSPFPSGRGGGEGVYQDIKGFCKSATIEEVRKLDYVLTPGRYVGLADEEDDFDFEERFTRLKAEFMEQLKEEEKLNKLILENLEKIELPNLEENKEN